MSSPPNRSLFLCLIMWVFFMGCVDDRVDTNTPQTSNPITCDTVPTCDTLPVNTCQGRLAVTYSRDPMACTCDVFTQYIDCAARGERCVEGMCVEVGERCKGKVCSPREPSCSGNTARRDTQPGVCNDDTGECEYDTVGINCRLEGLRCITGRCAPLIDPCVDETCKPPARTCEGDVLVRHTGEGTCMADGDKAVCDFSSVRQRVACTNEDKVCMGGNCVNPDNPCDGVTCDMPPAASCDAMVAVTYSGNGTCNMANGMCSYSAVEVRTDCAAMGQTCMNGARML